MTREQESITALMAVRNSIERVILCFYSVAGSDLSARSDRFSDSNLCFTLQNHLQILLSSFLEEWPRFAARAKSDLNVRETLKQVQVAMERFTEWKDLPSVRSQLLAHPFRDKQGNIVFAWDVFRDSKAPTTLAETLLLGFHALTVVDRIRARHANEIAEAESHLLPLDRFVPDKGITTPAELEKAFAKLQQALARTRDQ